MNGVQDSASYQPTNVRLQDLTLIAQQLSLWSVEVTVRRDRLTGRVVFAVLQRAEKFLAKYGKSSYRIGLN
jgi:hypothetical protein